MPYADHFLTTASGVRTSPKWSFGGKSPATLSSNVPGPGAYNEAYAVKTEKAPQYRFGSEARDTSKLSNNPGPGQYNVSSLKDKTGWTMGGRREAMLKDASPGPAAYNPALNQKGPEWGFHATKRDWILKSTVPGPGTYSQNDASKRHASPAWTMTRGARGNDMKSTVPGPASYSVEGHAGQQGPKYTMSGRAQSNQRDLGPGPAAYTLNSGLGGTSKYSMGSKVQDLKKNEVPGPGTYTNQLNNVRQQSPVWRFSTSTRDARNNANVPGPGTYNANASNKAIRGASPQWGFGTLNRDSRARDSGPGPANYNLPEKIGVGPKYSIGAKQNELGKNEVPGPGQYNPNAHATKLSSQQFRFGSLERGGLGNSSTPGPGTYDPASRGHNPAYTMGARAKDMNRQGIDNIGSTYSQFGY
eukprot:Filipodium_phascolosomae@DN1872_c0_g1_i1.p1